MSLYQVDMRPKHDPASCQREPCGRCAGRSVSLAPEIPPNPQDASGPTPSSDPVVRAFHLPKHPEPSSIADALEAAAKAIRSSGLRAIDMASVLAARGYSSVTMGDGGSRSSDTTSRTERLGSDEQTDRWDAADAAYAALLRSSWLMGLKVKAQTDELIRHASDIDPTPAGTGECRACARFVRRTKDRPSYRLRSGLCPSCFGAWGTYTKGGGLMLWSEWTTRRRESFTERNASGQVVRIHTPEPDEDGQSA